MVRGDEALGAVEAGELAALCVKHGLELADARGVGRGIGAELGRRGERDRVGQEAGVLRDVHGAAARVLRRGGGEEVGEWGGGGVRCEGGGGEEVGWAVRRWRPGGVRGSAQRGARGD
ncbi:proline-rich receptor-like protein kinase PERK9 isoform X1 [Gracilaria domingensis]|nr:proline-rich receptor-like protein kinase PERK9 isoform X1 [Gracilaria domingensis]